MENNVEIFCCYARADHELLVKLEIHLRTLQRQNLASIWSDTHIDAGVVREQEIDRHLSTAKIILLLVSADFIASDYCYNQEMKRAMQRDQRGEAKVIPIILRPCNWKNTLFGALQPLPVNGCPVTDQRHWPNEDQPLADISIHIQGLVGKLQIEHNLCEAYKMYEKQDYIRALAHYDQVLQLEPRSAQAYRGKGDVLSDLARYEESLAAYADAEYADPNSIDVDICSKQAYAYVKIARDEEGLAAYDKALYLASDSTMKADLYRCKFAILDRLGRRSEASECYRAALLLDASNTHGSVHQAGGFPGTGRKRDEQPTPRFPMLHILRQMQARLRRTKTRSRIVAIACFLLAVVIVSSSVTWISYHSSDAKEVKPMPLPGGSDGIEAYKLNNEVIGISDGRFVLETVDPKGVNAEALYHKEQAARYLQAGNYSSALAQWSVALEGDNSNDAEARIYQENLNVLISGAPYITFVVGASFNAEDALSTPVLRGAFTLQYECDDHPDEHLQLCRGMKIRLLIANSGSDPARSIDIARQITRAAKADPHIVGVLGWTTTQTSLNIIPILAQAHIPMVGANPSGDTLKNMPFFFRVMPPNSSQSLLIASYVQKSLHLHHPVIFEDDNNTFSQTLANDLAQNLRIDNPQIQPFTIGKDQQVLAQMTRRLLDSYHPDVIFFTSYNVVDMTTLLNTVSDDANTSPQLKVVLGSGYQLIEAKTEFKGYERVLYPTGGFADMWNLLAPGKARPSFFCDYASAFDPEKLHQGPDYCGYPLASSQAQQKESPYTYTRPTSYDMLNYDGMQVLLTGSLLAMEAHKQGITPEYVRQGIAKITGLQAIQGVTGRISFGADGNSLEKIVVVLSVVSGGYLHMNAQQGCFLKTEACDDSSTHSS